MNKRLKELENLADKYPEKVIAMKNL